MRVTTLDLAGEALVEPPLWSPCGEFFVVLDNGGTLRKVRLADFTEIQKLELGAACTGLGLASSGLVIAVAEWQAEKGQELKQLTLGEPDEDHVLFSPHPKGGRLLVSGDTETWWVDLSPPPAAP